MMIAIKSIPKTHMLRFLIVAFLSIGTCYVSFAQERPNVLWILIEDASCHISCYGEKSIHTPNIDQLAAEGIRFEKAFVTAPVCSPSRSAFVTGMYQNSIGAHNHRSQRTSGKGGGNTEYYDSYAIPESIPMASKLFGDAGYYTTNERMNGNPGKEDYNFHDNEGYSGKSWKDAPAGTPFFTQIQLKGGKNRSRRATTENFNLPPYYYEDELMRNDWKDYLGSWLDTDEEVKQIVSDLKKAGVYENTLIFFLTDHGISHLRGKQFLYDEGIQVPMIIKLPTGKQAGKVREDMVTQIDALPTSLAVAGIDIPSYLQGKDILADTYEPQSYVFSMRDRCDETTEIIRSVRSQQYKYIRNFLSYRPHAQRNQYKDGKEISKHMRGLFESNKLSELQSSFYQPSRPPEELYDLENDPYEIKNLANDPAYQDELTEMRAVLMKKMAEINDPGLIPEPILEDLGEKYGSKMAAMQASECDDIQERLSKIIEAGESGDIDFLASKVSSPDPSERYWAVTWMGVNGSKSHQDLVKKLKKDKDPTVRVAAHLAQYKIDPGNNPVPDLANELEVNNLLVGMYAMNALEQTGIRNAEVKAIAEKAANSDYEFTKRFGRYLVSICQ